VRDSSEGRGETIVDVLSSTNARCEESNMSPAMNLTGKDSGVDLNNLCPISQKSGMCGDSS
jgi:hypothetical protein